MSVPERNISVFDRLEMFYDQKSTETVMKRQGTLDAQERSSTVSGQGRLKRLQNHVHVHVSKRNKLCA
jgi:hypothetical protein